MTAAAFLRRAALAAAVAAALASGAGAAAADTSPSPSPASAPPRDLTLAAIKEHAAAAVAAREATLQRLGGTVQNARELTSGDRAALLAIFSDDEHGLTALGRRIAADTTVSAAWQDAQHIVTDYRVYVLAVPQTHLVVAADTVTAVSARLSALAPQLETAIAQAGLGDDQRRQAQAALSDYRSQVAAAGHAVEPVSSTVLSLTPAGYPGNRAQLSAALASVRQARADLAAARHDVDVIEALIRGR